MNYRQQLPISSANICFAVVCLLTSLLPAQSSLAALDAVEFVSKYCFECHSKGDVEAGISFSRFGGELDVWRNRSLWRRVADAIEQEHMPPESASVALPAATRAEFLKWLRFKISNIDVQKIPRTPGSVRPRRLNRNEYKFAIWDLLAVPVDINRLPADQTADDNFDNLASTLSVQPLLIEKYLELSSAIIDNVWENDETLERLIFAYPSDSRFSRSDEELPVVVSATRSKMLDMGDGSFAVLSRFRTTEGGALFAKAPPNDEWRPNAKTLYIGDGNLAYDIGWVGNFRTRTRVNDGKWHHTVLNVVDGRVTIYLDGKSLGSRRMSRPDVPGHRFKIGFAGDDDEFTEFSGGQIALTEFYRAGLTNGLAEQLSSGQAIAASPVFRWTREQPSATQPEYTEATATLAVIKRFLLQTFRRPPSATELARYVALHRHARQQGDDYVDAFRLPFTTALLSPAFLFRTERVQDPQQTYRITNWELASRLSFFLWASTPDAELLKLAASRRLSDPKILQQQVQRMLTDARAARFTERFTKQWLRIEGLGTSHKPDRELFPQVTSKLLHSMQDESVALLDSILRGDQSLLRILDADYTFVDEQLAAHYDLDVAAGRELQRVSLHDNQRGGILTHASILTVSSSPRRTSPVFRGKWILEVLLGDKPPPPPANVPSLEKQDADTPASLRDALRAHRDKSACRACHQRIDPLGFALESFDATGKLRKNVGDITGQLPGSPKFTGHRGLQQLLLNSKRDQFLRHFVSRMLVYALGRELEYTDEPALQGILDRLERDQLRSSVLIEAVVASYPFQYRQESSRDEVDK